MTIGQISLLALLEEETQESRFLPLCNSSILNTRLLRLLQKKRKGRYLSRPSSNIHYFFPYPTDQNLVTYPKLIAREAGK